MIGLETQLLKKLKLNLMIKTFILILITFFYITISSAEVINKIEVSGNSRVSSETIQIYGNVKINQDIQEQDINKILNNLYSTNFFEDVKISLINKTLKITVEEYPVINQLVIIGETSNRIMDEIKKILKLKAKDSFILSNLSSDVDTIKNLYSSTGFNFVQVETKTRVIDDKNIDLIFEIQKGEPTKISKIIFKGDKKVREKRLRDVIASEEDKFWKFISRNTKFSRNLINLDARLLSNYYKSMGYYDVKINSSSAEIQNSNNVIITYSIDAGNRYIIKKITTNVDPVFDKNLFYDLNDDYKKITGDYYSPFKIKNLLEKIDQLIEDNNLQFVEHNVEEIIEENAIIVKFNIFEGPKVLVERINVLGNNVTNESVVRGELLLDEGDPFTKLGLEKSISEIKSRNIFRSVESKVLQGSSSDLKVIDIIVEEQPTGEIMAGAGIGTSGGTVGFTVKENNWLGQGKNIGFDIELDSESLSGLVSYTDPNYDFLGNSINYYISSTSNDKPDQGYENSLVNAGVGTRFEQYEDIFASLGVSASYDDLQTTDAASDSLKKQSGAFKEIEGNYGFSYDRRNRSFKPTDGSLLTFNQSLPIYADRSFVSNTISSSFYEPISEDVTGAVKFIFSSVNGIGGDDVRVSKRKSLSSKRLRGFERGKVGPVDGKDHVGGNYAAALNFEVNLPKVLPETTKTDINFFLDFGNIWGVDYDTQIDKSSKIRSSTGVAAEWLSPLGPMTFIFSQNLSKASTDVTESFNFNLGTTF
jgi:outer membrane protein insertion porin family